MAKAAETAEKTSGALARGNTKEATETAKAGAAMLHELARQVKGELAREVAEELAMARDLADELAEREAELAQMPSGDPGSSADQDEQGRPRQVGQRRQGRGQPRRLGRLDRRRATRAAGGGGQDPGALAERCKLARRGRVGRADPGIDRGEAPRPRSSSAWSGSASSTSAVKSRRPAARRTSSRGASRCSLDSSTCCTEASSRRSSPTLVEFDKRVAELIGEAEDPQDRRRDRRVAPAGRGLDPRPGESRTDPGRVGRWPMPSRTGAGTGVSAITTSGSRP